MNLTPAERADLDLIAAWLRLEDDEPAHVDVTLLFGGSMPDAWDTAAAAVRRGATDALVLVGRGGHTTETRGYLAHVDVPDDVETAYAGLLAAHPDWGRPATG